MACGGPDVSWEQALSHQWPTAEQNCTYCKRSQNSLTNFSSIQLLLFYIGMESGQFLKPKKQNCNYKQSSKLLGTWKRHRDHTENNPKHLCLIAKYCICNANKTPPYLQLGASFDHVVALGIKPLLIKVNKSLCIEFNELWVKTGTYSILERIQSGKNPTLVKLLTLVFLKAECLKGLCSSCCAASASTGTKPSWAPPESNTAPQAEKPTTRLHYSNCLTVNTTVQRKCTGKHKGAESRW